MSHPAMSDSSGQRLVSPYSGRAVTIRPTAVKRIHQLVAALLALCVAGAGAVGLNPWLHRLVEHGGHGAAHTHWGKTSSAPSAAHSHDHSDGHVHSHDPSQAHFDSIFAHSHRPFALPGISLGRLWHSLSHLFEPLTASESPVSNDGPGHEHHSLFQLMANGLVEQPLDVSIVPPAPTAVGSLKFSAHTPFIAREWSAQTAGRGPPFRQS